MLWLIPSDLKASRVNVVANIEHLGVLFTPRTYKSHVLESYPLKWAADNDSYSGKFNRDTFIEWLNTTMPYQSRCLFVACPDVVGDSVATQTLFNEWQPIIKSMGYPVGFVLQDGVTNVEWDKLDAVFVGGTTSFKLSQQVINILKEAKSRGKWVHAGRVNSLKRMSHFWDYADSCDGTDYIHHPQETVKMYLPFIRQRKLQMKLDY